MASSALSMKSCMNATCGVSTSNSGGWRKGWALRSGDFAILCDNCGSAYEQSIFCEVFHSNDSGWRECTSCSKRLHCGCIASRSMLELLDGGGVNCTSCSRSEGAGSMNVDKTPNGFGKPKVDNNGELQCASANGHLAAETKPMQSGNCIDGIGMRNLLQLQSDETNGSYRKMKQEDILPPVGEIASTIFLNFNQAYNASCQTAKPEIHRAVTAAKDLYESLAQTNLSMSLGSSLGNPNPFPGGVVHERVLSKASSPLQQGPRSRHLLPKPPKLALSMDANAGMGSQIRVARPPAEGRGRNQLLPRYWPRITDQELQQISGELSLSPNSTIVPLFEKVLSASDAGRIGRLVLPKACAEAYFPPISQPEGLPLRIQDVKGKEWVFQFRFWPNNNSRMYVLEGVTPCIQSMKLQAGDTVTFSRMDPEGKLVMGFRKASNTIAMQDTQPSAMPNGVHSSESYFSGVFENLPIISGYSGLLQSLKGSTDTHFSALHSASGDISWHKSDKQEDRTRDGLLLPSLLVPERKRTRNIGSKSKRLLIDSLDAFELKLTWEEAQDLLRPAPSVKPSIVTIEDHDFEEYEEPPVFGKRSIFIVRSIGGQEQWAQCDSCSKWRSLPVDALLPPKWTCVDNTWDQSRCSCSAPDELAPRELENLLRLNKDFKKRKMTSSHQPTQEHESSGLDALANAAILGDVGEQSAATTVATTTKHPRHRPGCSCIVCIQPPSGKGKHKPTCTCNVCMTVKRRFKTLMMRKKKRQSEREAEIAQKTQQHMVGPKDEAEVESSSKLASVPRDPSDNEARSGNELESKSQSKNLSNKLADSGKGHLDLNCHPDREEDSQAGLPRMSMTSFLQVASLPLDTYLKQNGLASLSEQQASSASHVPPQTEENEGKIKDDCQPASAAPEQESGGEENDEPGLDQSQNDPV